MRNRKIVADSSANLLTLQNIAFDAAPLKIITADREFVDNAALDLEAMIDYFSSYKGKSQTSCPNPEDWRFAGGLRKVLIHIKERKKLRWLRRF